MAPDPEQRSTTIGESMPVSTQARAASMAQPVTTSVSGRGTNTPGPTSSLEPSEPGPSGEVLQRDATRALGDEAGIPRRDGTTEDHEPPHLGGVDAEGVGRERDGVVLG